MKRTVRRLFAVIAAAALLGGGAACATTAEPTGPAATSPAAGAFPATVGSLTLEQRPERIVSLSATATEMLFAVDAGKQVVAVDEFSTYPADVPKERLSAFKPNAEAIAAYEPDLVVLSDDIDKIADQLKALRIPTFFAPAAKTINDTYSQITDLGTLTGHPAQATALTQRMRDDLAKLIKDVPKRSTPLTYYYELDPTYYSVTSKSFMGTIFAEAGLVNIADAAAQEGNAYPQLSAEVIVNADPDLIFLADAKCCGQSPATVAARSGWSGIAAVKSGGVVQLDDDVASRWGPRVVDLMRAVIEAIAKVPVS